MWWSYHFVNTILKPAEWYTLKGMWISCYLNYISVIMYLKCWSVLFLDFVLQNIGPTSIVGVAGSWGNTTITSGLATIHKDLLGKANLTSNCWLWDQVKRKFLEFPTNKTSRKTTMTQGGQKLERDQLERVAGCWVVFTEVAASQWLPMHCGNLQEGELRHRLPSRGPFLIGTRAKRSEPLP